MIPTLGVALGVGGGAEMATPGLAEAPASWVTPGVVTFGLVIEAEHDAVSTTTAAATTLRAADPRAAVSVLTSRSR